MATTSGRLGLAPTASPLLGRPGVATVGPRSRAPPAGSPYREGGLACLSPRLAMDFLLTVPDVEKR